MKTKKRQKLCYNCEGEVDLDVIVCPFCASDLREEKPELGPQLFQHHLKNLDTQATLYPPNFPPRVRQPIEREEEEEESISQFAPQEEESKGSAGAVVLLTLGAQLFLIGLFMLFFSKHGSLVLKWDARFWYFYVMSAIPLLIFGLKALK